MADLGEFLLGADTPELDLYPRLERVRISAERIWAVPRLGWFTDHSASRHSRRIIQLLGGLTDELQNGPMALTRGEVYVLLSAAYLHDIGMQDFAVDGRGQEEFGLADYELIRKRHPARAKELIVGRALLLEAGRDRFRIDIDDELQYLLPIALVSQGHGSSYFEETVAELREADYAPENVPLRGALLTALLLYADELDLHEDRASFPQEMSLSPLSALHHHVNHYVTRVAVEAGQTGRSRSVQLSFSFPPGSDEYQGDVRLYVTSKLASQANRINPVLRAETDGYLEIEPTIRVRSRTETIEGARRDLPVAALRRLRLEMLEQQLIDREDLKAGLRSAVESQRPLLVELVAGPESDLAAVLSWLEMLATNAGASVTHVDLELAVGTETSDLVDALAQPDEAPVSQAETLAEAPPTTLAAIAEELNDYAIWVLEGVDRLLPDTLDWLRSELAPIADTEMPVLVVMTRGDNSETVVAGAAEYRLDALSEEALAAHLARVFGDNLEEAGRLARDATLLSGGSPTRTLSAMSARLNRTWQADG